MYSVILYYHFTHVGNSEEFCTKHKQACADLNLLGRVYIAEEGINGTLSGTTDSIASYMEYLRKQPGFEQTEFKTDTCDYIPFRKLIVKTRPEMVTLKAEENIDLTTEKGKRLTPQAWRQVLESDEEYVLIDTRNKYESDIGHFEGAILPEVDNFFDFPQWVDQARIDKKKKVLMYCTGGIRCEKFSLLMEKKGFKDVYQLHGGIVEYGKQEGGSHYKGKCFVFDDRLAVPVDPSDQKPISKCAITGELCDAYLNCANPDCNKLFICSEAGALTMEGCCSETCQNAPRKRPLNPNNIYAPSEKWSSYT